jgi:hypothetical protein
MGIVNSRLRWRPKDSNTFTILNVESLNVQRNIDAESSIMDADFKAGFGSFNSVASDTTFFNAGDVFELFVANTAIDVDNDIPLFTASVKDISPSDAPGNQRTTLTMQDRTSLLLNLRIVEDFQNERSPEIIKVIGDKVNESVGSEVLTDPIDFETQVQTTRPDGSTFPKGSVTLIWKTAYEWIKHVSQLEYLNTPAEVTSGDLVVTKPFFFFVRENPSTGNPELVWHTRQDTTFDKDSDPIYYGQEGVFEMGLKKSIFETFNMIIYNCGKDKNGSGIWWYLYDENSKDTELRISVQPFNDIADSYRTELLNTDNKESSLSSAITLEASSAVVGTIGLFNAGGGYALIEQQDEYVQYASLTENTSTLNSLTRAKFNTPASSHGSGAKVRVADTYGNLSNNSFRDECKSRGTTRAQGMFTNQAGLRWKGKIVLRGTKTYEVGDNVPIHNARLGLTGQKMRVNSVTHSIDKSGWRTTLQVEEDPPAQGTGGST